MTPSRVTLLVTVILRTCPSSRFAPAGCRRLTLLYERAPGGSTGSLPSPRPGGAAREEGHGPTRHRPPNSVADSIPAALDSGGVFLAPRLAFSCPPRPPVQSLGPAADNSSDTSTDLYAGSLLRSATWPIGTSTLPSG